MVHRVVLCSMYHRLLHNGLVWKIPVASGKSWHNAVAGRSGKTFCREDRATYALPDKGNERLRARLVGSVLSGEVPEHEFFFLLDLHAESRDDEQESDKRDGASAC